MSVTVSIIISMLALLATFYQLYLQRVHNEKSLKPLGQIHFIDRDRRIAVQVLNNGLGPLIIDKLVFSKSDNIYSSIEDCLDLDRRSYMRVSTADLVQRVVLPNSYLTVFEASLEKDESETALVRVREQLTPITLKVEGRDIYDKKITVERDFRWFSRYMIENSHRGRKSALENE